MCIIGETESGHGGRFEPCAEYKTLDALRIIAEDENAFLVERNNRLEAKNAALRQERNRMAGIVSDLLDIAQSAALYCEGEHRYTHSFMSAGEQLWKLLGLTEPYMSEVDFDASVEKFRKGMGI